MEICFYCYIIVKSGLLLPFGVGDEVLLPAPGSQDGISDGINFPCTYFQTQEDVIFVSVNFNISSVTSFEVN